MAIMTISLTVHLIVRYRELLQAPEPSDAKKLVAATMTSKFAPCLYTALTTMAAFGSLTVSSIVPVEDFGWMMCIGLVLGLPSDVHPLPRSADAVGRAAGRAPVCAWKLA